MSWPTDFAKLCADYGVAFDIAGDHLVELNGRDAYEGNVSWSGHTIPDGLSREERRRRVEPEITVGFFEDDETRALHFFCALAASTQEFKPYEINDTHDAEWTIAAWKAGLKLADKHGYKFETATLVGMLDTIFGRIEATANEDRISQFDERRYGSLAKLHWAEVRRQDSRVPAWDDLADEHRLSLLEAARIQDHTVRTVKRAPRRARKAS